MQTELNNTRCELNDEKDVYTFLKEEGRWYIYLDDYLHQGGCKQDMELMEGAHRILDLLANGAKKLRLRLTVKPFEGANLLQLVEHCPAPRGGGIYLFNPHKKYNSFLFWICDLALFVFGDIPEQIYIKRLPLKAKGASMSRKAIAAKPDHYEGLSWFGKAA